MRKVVVFLDSREWILNGSLVGEGLGKLIRAVLLLGERFSCGPLLWWNVPTTSIVGIVNATAAVERISDPLCIVGSRVNRVEGVGASFETSKPTEYIPINNHGQSVWAGESVTIMLVDCSSKLQVRKKGDLEIAGLSLLDGIDLHAQVQHTRDQIAGAIFISLV